MMIEEFQYFTAPMKLNFSNYLFYFSLNLVITSLLTLTFTSLMFCYPSNSSLVIYLTNLGHFSYLKECSATNLSLAITFSFLF